MDRCKMEGAGWEGMVDGGCRMERWVRWYEEVEVRQVQDMEGAG